MLGAMHQPRIKVVHNNWLNNMLMLSAEEAMEEEAGSGADCKSGACTLWWINNETMPIAMKDDNMLCTSTAKGNDWLITMLHPELRE
jgi:hypothetical protein